MKALPVRAARWSVLYSTANRGGRARSWKQPYQHAPRGSPKSGHALLARGGRQQAGRADHLNVTQAAPIHEGTSCIRDDLSLSLIIRKPFRMAEKLIDTEDAWPLQ
jgi:hypothetical protein